MPVSLSIFFDRPLATYFAGETVSGRAVVKLDKSKKLRAIVITFKGQANVRWTERETRSRPSHRHGHRRTHTDSRSVSYTSSETYFETTHIFVGGKEGDVVINPGEYVYNFHYALPPTLPSSFEGTFGHIRYTVKAMMQRPWKFDHGAKAAFTVIAPLDLNMYPHVKEPTELEQSKSLCCLWCRSGPIVVRVRLPATGFVPGQAIVAQMQVDNASSTEVRGLVCALEKEVVWRASRVAGYNQHNQHTRTTKHDVFKIELNETVPARTSKSLTQVITVPPIPPSHLAYCNFIDLLYSLRVEALLGACHINLETKCQILVGTIPLSSTPTPVGTPTAEPSAPPYYPDMPCPSYEECVFGGNDIMDGDGDNEFTMGMKNFTPRYPVYAFGPHPGQ